MKLEDRTPQLASIHEKVFGHLKPRKASKRVDTTAPATADDRAVIDAVLSDLKYARLWHGDASGYGSGSEADLALVGRIAFFVGNDSARIDTIFRQSGLCREKWTQRSDYRDRTTTRALSGLTRCYNWTPLADRGRA